MRTASLLAVALTMVIAGQALAHFQEILPQTDMVADGAGPEIGLDLTFTHPMQGGPVMDMAPPVRFGVLADGKIRDLKSALTAAKAPNGKTFYRARARVDQPGDYVFFVEPAPYWDGGEGRFITHYAKVVVDRGQGRGWDRMVGLPVEIEPLVRPYGLWTNSLFRGVVRHRGKPVPFATIEVEWKNDGSVTVPSDAFIPQQIKADANGVFSFAMPRAGWWGFAALVDQPGQGKDPHGRPAKAELGGIMWVRTTDMK